MLSDMRHSWQTSQGWNAPLFNGVHKRFIDMYVYTLLVCAIVALDIVHPYVHTFRDTGIPIHIARSANMLATAKWSSMRPTLIGLRDVSPLPLVKLSIILPGRDLISRDNVAARTNVYTCAR